MEFSDAEDKLHVDAGHQVEKLNSIRKLYKYNCKKKTIAMIICTENSKRTQLLLAVAVQVLIVSDNKVCL